MLKDWGVAIGLAAAVYLAIAWLQPTPDLPDVAPEISVETLQGESFRLTELKGQVVVLNFWATWCGPCRKEIPDFTRFAEDYPQVPMIGISMDDLPPARVKAKAKALGIRYPVAMVTQEIRRAYNVRTLPTTVIVGPDGEVAYARTGTMSYQSLVRAVRKVSG